MNKDQQKTDNEFFSLDNVNVSKSAILPNDEFDKHEIDDENGIERPFTNSDNSSHFEFEHEDQNKHLQTSEQKFNDLNPTSIPLEQCQFCTRKFFIGRLALHQKTCTQEHPLKIKINENENNQKNKLFFQVNKPINDSEQNKLISSKKKQNKQPLIDDIGEKNNKNLPKWKIEHQQLVQSIRFSREIDKAEKNGQNIKELKEKAPRNPLESNYVFCEFCQRRFAPYVAERHIPRCKNVFNRPQPPKLRQIDHSLDQRKKPEPKALEKYSQFVGASINEELEEVDNDINQHQHSQTVKAPINNNVKMMRESNTWQSGDQRMSQSQQQDSSGQSVFLPRIQKSPQHYVSILSRSVPLVQCPYCSRSFDQQASQRHIPICEKIQFHIEFKNHNNKDKMIQINRKLKSLSSNTNNNESIEKQNQSSIEDQRSFCTNCGTKFANIHKYCGICGKKRFNN